ncbi:YihA family ribosome biogenesis GTP-binding protein [Taibaiella lutea]|uniref:Probable GTP-binding protein EngB n=1 Tax=Taibaiella lutea TaxID=2608001 RepID=A0A5M6CDG8_9BACT|nr:ribosome biogenesis GTP-binding protein YihA/YsxC [Taibaiella lutea]KAA5533166.1 YihA family ribosome biogenesis GTP-binding protein [Taibaiella lutea]
MEINNASYVISSAKVEQCPPPDKPEYAFIGRSNVGKSSLINMITNNAKLAKVSKTPGKTTLINHFLINGERNADTPWYMVDLPGYGYAKRSQTQRVQWQKMLEAYFRTRENLQTVFVLIDSRISPQQIDLDFLVSLGEWGIPFNMIFTKADKNTQSETAKNVKNFVSRMKEQWEYIPRYFVTSAVKALGRKDLLSYIDEVNLNFNPDEPRIFL